MIQLRSDGTTAAASAGAAHSRPAVRLTSDARPAEGMFAGASIGTAGKIANVRATMSDARTPSGRTSGAMTAIRSKLRLAVATRSVAGSSLHSEASRAERARTQARAIVSMPLDANQR